MRREEEALLKKVLELHGANVPRLVAQCRVALRKQGFENPLNNSMWSNLLDTALKGLEVVSAATFDWKLLSITKLLQSWLKEKREEREKEKQQTEYGAGLSQSLYQSDPYSYY